MFSATIIVANINDATADATLKFWGDTVVVVLLDS